MSERTEQQCDGPEEVKMSIGDCELTSVWRLTAEAIKHRIEHEGGSMSDTKITSAQTMLEFALQQLPPEEFAEFVRLMNEADEEFWRNAEAHTRGAHNNLKEMYKQIICSFRKKEA